MFALINNQHLLEHYFVFLTTTNGALFVLILGINILLDIF